jgi:hypothetical protein
MGVVGERLHDVGSRVDDLLVQRLHPVGMLEHDLGHEGARLQITAALELEQIAFGADHGASGEPFPQAAATIRRVQGRRHGVPPTGAAPWCTAPRASSVACVAMPFPFVENLT